MICSRRAVLRLGLGGFVTGVAPTAVATEPVWIGPPDVDEFTVLGDEIITIGDRIRALDSTTGQELRSARLRKPSTAEGPDTITATGSTILFGWYVWYGDVHISCVNARSLQIEWQQRIKIIDRERENIPYVVPLIASDAVFVVITNKQSENLFRLGRNDGRIVWSRYVPRFTVRRSLAWHANRLLVRSRVKRGAQAFGDLYAIDPATGSTLWQIRLEGQDDAQGDTMLIAGNRAYIAAPVPPGEGVKLHIVDLAAGSLVNSITIDRLGDPFAYRDGIVYFGGSTPTAWDAAAQRPIWRVDVGERRARVVYVTDAVLDVARQRIYLGESDHSFLVLSATDGAVLGSVDVRRGYTSPNIMAVYGAHRMRLVRDLLLVGAGERRLFAYGTASLF